MEPFPSWVSKEGEKTLELNHLDVTEKKLRASAWNGNRCLTLSVCTVPGDAWEVCWSVTQEGELQHRHCSEVSSGSFLQNGAKEAFAKVCSESLLHHLFILLGISTPE